MARVRVPLAVDAQLRIPLGPMLLPLRTLFLIAATTPLALCVVGMEGLDLATRLSCVLVLYMLACTIAAPEREGVWIVAWLLYRCAGALLPTAVVDGVAMRARVTMINGAVRASSLRALPRWFRLPTLAPFLGVPPVRLTDNGVAHIGSELVGVLALEAHGGTSGTTEHAAWCGRMTSWLFSLDCPVQVITSSEHFSSAMAREAFDARIAGWPATPLAALERELASRIAEQSLGFRHYVLLLPGLARNDGMFQRLIGSHPQRTDAATVAASVTAAVRLAAAAGIAVHVPDHDELAALVARTLLGARHALAAPQGVQFSEQLHRVVCVVRLPAVLHHGAIVDCMLRSRFQGIASLHLAPVEAQVTRKLLDRRMALHRYSAREGNDEVDNQVAMADGVELLAAIARRTVRACRLAIAVSACAATHDELDAATARLIAALRAEGFDVVAPSHPGFIPLLAATPGGMPLRRCVQLTTEEVAACLVPALATPFADRHEPLLGLAEATGAPAYMSVWRRPNHNAVVLGSSGSGKSVTVKTLLVRHAMEGARVVVIDPDSEYRRVLTAIGGRHMELGPEALNPLAPGMCSPPGDAAGLVLPVLSVMAGDERGLRDGRPIRRLPDEDQGFLYAATADFFTEWRSRERRREPVLHDLLDFIDRVVSSRMLSMAERERCRVISARLSRFVQGDRASVFDRPSSFRIDETSVGVGLRSFAMTYGADLTPALAIVLTTLLAQLRRMSTRIIVVVDEAHRVTGDPDAGEVLGGLVRQARKYGAGVWMCSQRVEDFVATDLGRTLASTASTKIVMGVEEAALAELRNTFGMRDDELAAVHPATQGRGVVIAGAERCVVRIVPGPAILALSDTSPEITAPAAA